MPKRSRKKMPKDMNQLAAKVVEISTAAARKNPAAVALGRLGGLKGGKARKEKLSPEQRRQIASNAARARWASEKKG